MKRQTFSILYLLLLDMGGAKTEDGKGAEPEGNPAIVSPKLSFQNKNRRDWQCRCSIKDKCMHNIKMILVLLHNKRRHRLSVWAFSQ